MEGSAQIDSTMDVYLNGKKVRLRPNQAIAKGGEADIFDLGKGQVLKLFKPPSHPDYQGFPQEQQAAQARIAEHQQKLPQFPKQLPDRIVQPQALVTDQSGRAIVGYTMPLLPNATVLLKYSDRSFRQAGISHQQVVELFQDLHQTLTQLHAAKVVVGDFNDLNVLVKDQQAYLIDADSFQFGSFLCQVFTTRFVDPLLCSYQSNRPLLVQPHNAQSDWYAFTIMLMQCLLFVDPYGGVYKPKNPADKVPHDARPAQRITVFHPAVKYPKPALPYRVLSDDLLHHFHQVFEQDWRGAFPKSLLQTLQWQTCDTCGQDHARPHCPDCGASLVGQVLGQKAQPAQVVRGTVTATRLFSTEGTIVAATLHRGKLCWLYHDRQDFRREDGGVLLQGRLDPSLEFGLWGESTLIYKAGQLVTLSPGQAPVSLAAEGFAVGEAGRHWMCNGQLLRDGPLGPVYVGDVLTGQTRFWVGSQFGFGFYRAGDLSVAFVFDAQRSGLNDQVAITTGIGQLLHSRCTFAGDRVWFFTITQEQGNLYHRCTIIRANGTIEATAQAHAGEESWLAQAMHQQVTNGNCAAGDFLLVATDEGILRVQPHQGTIVKAKEFPDTEPFVDGSSQLFAGREGLYVVKPQEILLLAIR